MIVISTKKEQVVLETAQRIRCLRKERRLSQEELALNAGINPAYLGHIERGLKCPTIDTINKIATALGISLADFFGFSSTVSTNELALDRIQVAIKKVSDKDALAIAQIVETIAKLLSS